MWYAGNSTATHDVGSKPPNPWGLYDMHGNVWDWCSDWYGTYDGDATNPTGTASGSGRVIRGGGWQYNAGVCRSAHRLSGTPTTPSSGGGFRVVWVQ
jgi:formylglycine-generating enzyme required for sulfatase activity